MEPSRWRCSSAFGRVAIRSESECGVIRERSVRQLRTAGVFPCRKPKRADICCRIGKLANQNCRGLIVKTVVIFVVESTLVTALIALVEKVGLRPATRTDACLDRS